MPSVAFEKSAPNRLAKDRSTPPRSAKDRSAPPRFALFRNAPVRIAPVRFAPNRFALLRFALFSNTLGRDTPGPRLIPEYGWFPPKVDWMGSKVGPLFSWYDAAKAELETREKAITRIRMSVRTRRLP